MFASFNRPDFRAGAVAHGKVMSDRDDEERAELLRLREENLELREERLYINRSWQPTSNPNPPPGVVNVNQTNESFLSGCASVIGMFVFIVFALAKCSGH